MRPWQERALSFCVGVALAALCAIAAGCGAGEMTTKATNTAAGDVTTTWRTPSLYWPHPMAPRSTKCGPEGAQSCEEPTCPNGVCAVPPK